MGYQENQYMMIHLQFTIRSENWFIVFKYKDPDYNEAIIDFLKEIQPYIENDLLIQSIGCDRLTFPFSAHSWFTPAGNGDIKEHGMTQLKQEIE